MSDNPQAKSHGPNPIHVYGDHELFGSRSLDNDLVTSLKQGNDSECLLINFGTAESKNQWKLKDLISQNKHLISMLQANNINHPFPIQRYTWSKLDRCKFTNLIISPQSTGKTYCHILYAVSKCILSANELTIRQKLDGTTTDDVIFLHDNADLKPLIVHPKYIVICSSQGHVESINRTIEQLKRGAYHLTVEDNRTWLMPPVVRPVSLQLNETELSSRCQESDILVGTPLIITKCLNLGYIHFSRCHKVFFDDLDVLLQIQNNNLRELMKIYLRQTDPISDSISKSHENTQQTSRIHFFSRKWTDLVRQFMSNLFPQRVILFGSLAEAAVHYNMKFDVESYESDQEKLAAISDLINIHKNESTGHKMCIVTTTDEEAGTLGRQLTEMNHIVRVIREDEITNCERAQTKGRSVRDSIFVISDLALEFLVEVAGRTQPLDDVVHIIHVTLPDDMLLFDQRFRLVHRHIRDEKSGLSSTILIGPELSLKLAKHVYDLMSRSAKTQLASKLTMRDYIIGRSPEAQICWRWATTGLCRLEKLSRDDRFGSYCFDRHSLSPIVSNSTINIPETGYFKITITNILSPSEFYFRFESYRNYEDGKWAKLDEYGNASMKRLQTKLDQVRQAQPASVPLSQIRRGRIFAVFVPELCRVDRICLLDGIKDDSSQVQINPALEYSKLIPVVKIDYGIRVHVKVRNLIALSEEVAQMPAQAHRGFHLCYKPPDNEPNWLSRSKERFCDLVTGNRDNEVSAWLRFKSDKCFWFENLTVSRELANVDSRQITTNEPHRQLHLEALAELTNSEPQILSPSMRLATFCKWNHDRLKDFAQFAFLERHNEPQEIFLIDVSSDFNLSIRQSRFDRQLKQLEREISEDFIRGKLTRLNYFVTNVYCLALVTTSDGRKHWNRVRIDAFHENIHDIESHDAAPERRVRVYCLDYGDYNLVKESELYRATTDHIRILPFQAIHRKMANINHELLSDPDSGCRVRQLMLQLVSDTTPILCALDENSELYLYYPISKTTFAPLSRVLLGHDVRILQDGDSRYEDAVRINRADEEVIGSRSDFDDAKLREQILNLLRDIVKSEFQVLN